tara:strand:- start:6836 stop:7822 length:987 start_codon:yes stop_codon:yes gene_type:complete
MRFTLLVLLSLSLHANELPNLLDHKKDDKLLPVTYYFNTAFDVIQNPYYFSQSDYRAKHEAMFKRISSFDHSVKKDGGYKKLFEDEFLTARILPNVGLHMIGGAYDKLYLYQYFKENNYPAPMVFTFALSYMGHFGNEALELTNENITSHDHIADLFFFDAMSFYLAFNPKIMNFLVSDLEMQAWHLQPMFNFEKSDVTNAGLNYIFRPDFFDSKFRPMLLIGMLNLAGVSYELSPREFITTAFGMALTDPLEQKGKFVSAFFYDNEKSLAAALYLNGTEEYRVRLNLFPEIFNFDSLKLGLLLGQKRDNSEVVGVNINLPIGLAFGD